MNFNLEKISAAIESSRKSGPVYCEIDSRMKCEIFFIESKLRFILCLYRASQKHGQLGRILQKRHTFPDQYASLKIGTDPQMNLYAGKTIVFVAPRQVETEIEKTCEFLTQ
ncbi:hypothetical protein FKG94_05235 [Exilibacterium tricleocarpae]|uniref:Uncharacterized protein n=1 Tax=Exilibacterium tricleocarpae TaxID=2591008 RepID=A0A545U3M5_9GAMM|nr:hypothetical protein [Exilibacterium tricleocarpae]TQV84071.1 hypothetical protein FKG94_05235 [Exilibacterium tricleocarpae]